MSAAPVLLSLPHMPRYPLCVAGTWRATCKCHWWAPFAVEHAANLRGAK